MSEQENTPSLFRVATFIACFGVAFVVVKFVFAVAMSALFYGAVALAATAIAVGVVKKLNS